MQKYRNTVEIQKYRNVEMQKYRQVESRLTQKLKAEKAITAISAI